jgi:hypothetical protein
MENIVVPPLQQNPVESVMPITLPAISRREFLVTSIAAGATLSISSSSRGDQSRSDPNRFALLADTHIAGDRDAVVRGVHLSRNLQQVSQQIVEQHVPVAAAMINGDCAYLSGEVGDYRVLVDGLAVLRKGGVPVHLTLGNHDHRARFWDALPADDGQGQHVESRHITVIPSPHANWFLLDSLDITNKTPGRLGQQQLGWLGKSLDAHTDRPALVMVHHNPDVVDRITGLLDTKPLMDVLSKRKHVQALFFGHTHNWSVQQQDGLYLVNQPPVAYVFRKGRPNGWLDMRIADGGATLQLNCLDTMHELHGETKQLEWRS